MIETTELNEHGVEIFRYNNVRDAMKKGYMTGKPIYITDEETALGKEFGDIREILGKTGKPLDIACFLIIETERDFEEFDFELRKYITAKKELAFIIDMSEGKGLNSFEWNSEGELVEVKENFVPRRVRFLTVRALKDAEFLHNCSVKIVKKEVKGKLIKQKALREEMDNRIKNLAVKEDVNG